MFQQAINHFFNLFNSIQTTNVKDSKRYNAVVISSDCTPDSYPPINSEGIAWKASNDHNLLAFIPTDPNHWPPDPKIQEFYQPDQEFEYYTLEPNELRLISEVE